jgi:glycosyltransferase involved in cell wall biosynthesis
VFEGLPLVLTEAMSVGTPFVAYDVNYGPSEVIRHEVDGLLVPSGDVDALAHGLIRILGDPGYAAQLGRRAREVTDRFSAERWATSWLHLYDELADTSITSRQPTTIS